MLKGDWQLHFMSIALFHPLGGHFNDVLCTTVLAKLLNIISTAKPIFRADSYFIGF